MEEKQLAANIAALLEENPFKIDQEKKEKWYADMIPQLHQHHLSKCSAYRNIWTHFNHSTKGRETDIQDAGQFRPLPVSLFKQHLLSSIAEDEIYKILASSGTTGSTPSRVPLDQQTAEFQQRALANIMTSFLGSRRRPMLIIDHPQILNEKAQYSARAAGILGFSMYGSGRCFALDDNLNIDINRVQAFLERHQGKQILVFGFTYLIWQTLYLQLKKKEMSIDLSNAILVHGGGWKKLKEQAVSEEMFRQGLYETCGLKHVSNYSEIIIRNLQDFSICQRGEEGVIQIMTPLALSYPGHNLLTEDKGVLLGMDDCPCGRKGKYFKLTGRMKQAEIRGCSDVYADVSVVGKS